MILKLSHLILVIVTKINICPFNAELYLPYLFIHSKILLKLFFKTYLEDHAFHIGPLTAQSMAELTVAKERKSLNLPEQWRLLAQG
jgi:hypothetical protein